MIQKKNSKIVFWGTPEFALPALEALFKNNYHLAAVITNPDKPAGRKNVITPPPTKVWAEQHKIRVFQPENLKMENCRPTGEPRPKWAGKLEIPLGDIYIVAAYGKIIPEDIINLPQHGSLNIHPSLLPRWRGPSPIQYTILNGDTETGVTIIKMDEKTDHGPIVAMRRLEFSTLNFQFSKMTFTNLHNELAKLGAELLIETLPKWLAGGIKPIPQNEVEATYSKILKKEDGRIDWSWPAEKIEKMVRALTPWPGVWTTWHQEKKKYRLRIEGVEIFTEETTKGLPGYVWQNQNHHLLVKTGKNSLIIKKLTLEGKKSMRAEDFWRGSPQITRQTLL